MGLLDILGVMKIAILGYGGQGRSAYDYWSAQGHDCTVCDANSNLQLSPDVKTSLGKDYLKNLQGFDLLVRTPALHPQDIVAANPNSSDILDRVTTVTNEFMRICPSSNIIGVTGTKGKGTTSTLIAKMLEAAGKTVHLGGNIGIPPLDLLKRDIRSNDWIVLELANFQLIDLKYSPPLAVCLMVEQEHTDWHRDFDEYILAKQQLFIHQTTDDIAIFYSENKHSKHIAGVGLGKKIPYYAPPGAYVVGDSINIDNQEICKTRELQLLGKHNWQNVCAALTAVWQITQDLPALHTVLTSFSGLPHRLELVREIAGIKYYNDSFASGPPATIAALQAIPEPKVIILGGYDRELPINQLAQAVVQSKVQAVVIIGATSHKVEEALRLASFEKIIPGGNTMTEIVQTAQSLAHPGDAVILSPGFASFDMFKNFEDRGLQFKTAVEAL